MGVMKIEKNDADAIPNPHDLSECALGTLPRIWVSALLGEGHARVLLFPSLLLFFSFLIYHGSPHGPPLLCSALPRTLL